MSTTLSISSHDTIVNEISRHYGRHYQCRLISLGDTNRTTLVGRLCSVSPVPSLVMVYLKYDARHNVCAYLDVTNASTFGFRDAFSWLSRSKEVWVTEDTIREVLNNGEERRHKINANMDDIIACFNRMGYVGNFKKDLVIKTMLSRE
ncbi:hypothetical protein L1987_23991 [Smallanthus sonchifolius]|uniref:Uncharacterized protein n=1 Tax=Smallanthus sonchifolius TaxID=185202 RepID=A0ACB9IJ79_9ASTR|nr:hypothetical protein L1987_23991 [Smallanthus sonchifolius]